MTVAAAVADRSPSPDGRQAQPGERVIERSPRLQNDPSSSHGFPIARPAGAHHVSADPAAPGSADRAAPDRAAQARAAAEAVYRAESRRVFATLVRLLGDFDLAEEALADAFRAALEQWPRDGVPANPRAWLVSACRFKAIDGIRRHARFVAMDDVSPAWDPDDIEDDRLRLIFTCCHPALSPDAQVALTLREVCGLTT